VQFDVLAKETGSEFAEFDDPEWEQAAMTLTDAASRK